VWRNLLTPEHSLQATTYMIPDRRARHRSIRYRRQ
jgi:hypothetical protein